jgi:Zn-finger nucleic acid-binding protein
MDCPRCITPLLVTDRQGIQIDHCPRCRGVWLDRGELDKIVERSLAFRGDDDSDWGDDRRRYGPPPQGYGPSPHGHPPGGYPPRKKEGFFGRLFDFD